MKVRLLAYRKATDSATSDSTFELDLMDNPNVPLNFKFSDIKNPETRKSSYSQTFKLPFTIANNEFFQNWFEVNLETLVFSASKKFDATLMVGSVPQFEGYIQLKSIYKKAEVYEVVLMSNTATLFSVLGEQKLQDIFLESDGSYSRELNHNFTKSNIINSWNGSSSSFVNVLSQSLRDTDANVQKVMYPLQVTVPNFYFNTGSNEYLAMSDTSGDNAWEKKVPITQLRPSIQIKYLLKRLIAKAGFSYTSNFIDGTGDYTSEKYFSKLFMTTGNTLEAPELPSSNTGASEPSGSLQAYQSTSGISWGFWSIGINNNNCASFGKQTFRADTDLNDSQNAWNTSLHAFKKVSTTMESVSIAFRGKRQNLANCDFGSSNSSRNIIIYVYIQQVNSDMEEIGDPLFRGSLNFSNYWTGSVESTVYQYFNHTIDISGLNEGTQWRIKLQPESCKRIVGGLMANQGYLAMTGTTWNGGTIGGNPYKSLITANWISYNLDQYDAEIDVPACIDDTITQKAFLKDIIERFNLVILTDPNDPSNLIIEPFNDYISSGTTKHWTDKLDVSKERVVKSTTSLQKKILNYSDLEDVDLMNKAIKEVTPSSNVYGKYFNDKTNNDFAKGELKNTPIFSPYINGKVLKYPSTTTQTNLPNLVVQYEISYKENSDGTIEQVLEGTKPKLFYYCGVATPIDIVGTESGIYLHQTNLGDGSVTAHNFTTYPVCTPYDIPDISSTGTYQLTKANKSLYWNFAIPQVPEMDVFDYQVWNAGWEKNSLFHLYWQNYLNDIYSSDARIMECHLNLNEVDIYDFKFNDQIFIKDTYWRILEITNYQVGAKTSTKVLLIKVLDSLFNVDGCSYTQVGQNGNFFTWCPDTNPDCTPDLNTTYSGYYVEPACCEAMGGQVDWSGTGYSSQGLYPCIPDANSLPPFLKTDSMPFGMFGKGNVKTILEGKFGGRQNPLLKGSDTNKYSQNILPFYGDDITIKYKTKDTSTAQVEGESHKIILIGNTEGTTKGYAYAQNDSKSRRIYAPIDSTTMVQVSGITTVIGGTSATYLVGDTESFNYHTAFVNKGGHTTQIGGAGGTLNWSIKQTSTTSTLDIVVASDGEIQFGLDDSQADTKKLWTLDVPITVQRISYLAEPQGVNVALYQNSTDIVLMNYQNLLWN
jgi:hypothetical protein